MFFYCLMSAVLSTSAMPGGPWLLRAPNVEKKRILYYRAVFCIIPFWGLPYFFSCATEVIAPFMNSLELWQLLGVLIAIFFNTPILVLLFRLTENAKVRRNVRRLLADCQQDGSMRAIYEMHRERATGALGSWEWVAYDLMQDGYSLHQLAKRAIQGDYFIPVLVVMNIPAEQVLQKLEQYNLITKNGYKRLPPAKSGNIFFKGGSSVLFYYQAEYVSIRG